MTKQWIITRSCAAIVETECSLWCFECQVKLANSDRSLRHNLPWCSRRISSSPNTISNFSEFVSWVHRYYFHAHFHRPIRRHLASGSRWLQPVLKAMFDENSIFDGSSAQASLNLPNSRRVCTVACRMVSKPWANWSQTAVIRCVRLERVHVLWPIQPNRAPGKLIDRHVFPKSLSPQRKWSVEMVSVPTRSGLLRTKIPF